MSSSRKLDPEGPSLTVRLFRSEWHDCSYLTNRSARTLFVDPHLPKDDRIHSLLQESGFRRSGNEIYRPDCAPCQACIPSRIPVRRFTQRRRHRRCLKSNRARFNLTWERARLTPEYLELYRLYIRSRHQGSSMENPSAEDFRRFLMSSWCNSQFLCVRDQERLVAIAVTDISSAGFSAVYTFFHPEYQQYGLGVFCLLNQLIEARRIGMEWLYLGFWVPGCQKMSYKTEYRPIQLLINQQWVEIGAEEPLPHLATTALPEADPTNGVEE